MWEWCSKLLRQYLINQNQPKLYLIIREWTKNNFCSYTLTNPFMFMWLCCSHQMVQHVEHSGNVNKLKGISYLNSTGIPTQRFPVYRLIIFYQKLKDRLFFMFPQSGLQFSVVQLYIPSFWFTFWLQQLMHPDVVWSLFLTDWIEFRHPGVSETHLLWQIVPPH